MDFSNTEPSNNSDFINTRGNSLNRIWSAKETNQASKRAKVYSFTLKFSLNCFRFNLDYDSLPKDLLWS